MQYCTACNHYCNASSWKVPPNLVKVDYSKVGYIRVITHTAYLPQRGGSLIVVKTNSNGAFDSFLVSKRPTHLRRQRRRKEEERQRDNEAEHEDGSTHGTRSHLIKVRV